MTQKAVDRLWLALAAYNIGLGHLRDAQKLTRQLGGNPYRWADIKKYLPLLKKKKWYSKTHYSAARGDETVDYVDSVRAYDDLMKWTSGRQEHLMAVLDEKKAGIGKG